MKKIVDNYKLLVPLETVHPTLQTPQGDSAAPKGLIFHILDDTANCIEVLDIGFGTGKLGQIIKGNETTKHWIIDGIDGLAANCFNMSLISQRVYRNIWHGLAQELPTEQFKKYKIICLLDVIEHLTANTAKWLLQTILTNMNDDAFLFISTPLWFYPQDSNQTGDLEEHKIGIPASSMIALLPVMYSVNNPLIGGFVYTKRSLDFIEFFQPTTDKSFSYEKGLAVANAVRLECRPGILIKT